MREIQEEEPYITQDIRAKHNPGGPEKMATLEIPVPQIVTDAISFVLPKAYIDWWVNLLHENPTHLYIETTLVSCLSFHILRW